MGTIATVAVATYLLALGYTKARQWYTDNTYTARPVRVKTPGEHTVHTIR